MSSARYAAVTVTQHRNRPVRVECESRAAESSSIASCCVRGPFLQVARSNPHELVSHGYVDTSAIPPLAGARGNVPSHEFPPHNGMRKCSPR
ncbi:hypothetical protein ZHAS_00014012 [Anopheles sinensis]|uniref:Uncharacterized protein n=1 Tax=Anopheles sinensis TaxID=74873 RepID=A0A084W746_ANOSI|nr:hypothetical protein ZHAS_00014012 [Anopheles sinensis]